MVAARAILAALLLWRRRQKQQAGKSDAQQQQVPKVRAFNNVVQKSAGAMVQAATSSHMQENRPSAQSTIGHKGAKASEAVNNDGQLRAVHEVEVRESTGSRGWEDSQPPALSLVRPPSLRPCAR